MLLVVCPETRESSSTYLKRSNEVGLVMQEDGTLVRADVDVAGLWKNRSAQNDLCKMGSLPVGI